MDVQITNQLAKDIIITCVETPFGDWFLFRHYRPEEGTVTVVHPDEKKLYNVTVETIRRGVGLLEPGKNIAEWLVEDFPEDFDSVLADAILQLALLGEIVYG